jgi:hypothetical protein
MTTELGPPSGQVKPPLVQSISCHETCNVSVMCEPSPFLTSQ